MENLVAKIAVSKAIYQIDMPYDYLIPDTLSLSLAAGMRVLIPFGGGNRICEGFVLSISPFKGEFGGKIKSILAQLDEVPVLDEQGIRLALWMREQYYCTAYAALKAMLPTGLFFSLRNCVCIPDNVTYEQAFEAAGQSKDTKMLVEILFSLGGRADLQEIYAAFGTKNPNAAIKRLVSQQVATIDTTAARTVADKVQKTVHLAIPAEEAMMQISSVARKAPLQYAVIEFLCGIGAEDIKELCYYTGASTQTIKALQKKGLVSIIEKERYRNISFDEVEKKEIPVLNTAQTTVFQGINKLLHDNMPCVTLLHGVTGSGKTQVYIRLIHEVIQMGKTAIVMVPEIALTPQTMRHFACQFGGEIALLHSNLRTTERYDEWKRIRDGKVKVVVGTRSAVFAPLKNIGMIILDEEQENSYKSENNPRYHAREVAKFRCVQENGLLLLGSATPTVESMYQAQSGRYHYFELSERFNEKALPEVSIVDMKKELRNANASTISKMLQSEIEQNLSRGEQTILLLNRRGTNKMVSCGECGHVAQCPRCSVYLTYHSANHRLMCHHCGHTQPVFDTCPECGGKPEFSGIGIQKVYEDLTEIFPSIKILRMDSDTVTASRTHEMILSEFEKEKVPILIGTQMVAKGLDFENVTLVGVISADMSLYVDDFHASERTFSLITQVVGRAGRGDKKGRAIIQTVTPENNVIVCAANQDYHAFYQQEIILRSVRALPPFSKQIHITCSGTNETDTLKMTDRLRQTIDTQLALKNEKYSLLGPAPEPIFKLNGRYRYRLTYFGNSDRQLRQLIAFSLRAAMKDKQIKWVSAYADAEPN